MTFFWKKKFKYILIIFILSIILKNKQPKEEKNKIQNKI